MPHHEPIPLEVLCGVVLVALAGNRLAAQDNSNLPTCFVAPFSGDTTAIQYWQPAMGEGLGEMLTTELGKINKFQMLEVNQIGDLKNEINMGEDGWIDQAAESGQGRVCGGGLHVHRQGDAIRFQGDQNRLGGFVPGSLGNLGVKQTVSDVRIDWAAWWMWRPVKSSRPARRRRREGNRFQRPARTSAAMAATSVFDNQEFVDSALGKATVKALSPNHRRPAADNPAPVRAGETKGGVVRQGIRRNDALKHTPGKVSRWRARTPSSCQSAANRGSRKGTS